MNDVDNTTTVAALKLMYYQGPEALLQDAELTYAYLALMRRLEAGLEVTPEPMPEPMPEPCEDYAAWTDTRLLTVMGETRSVRGWADSVGVHPTTILTRLSRGWTPLEAVTLPRYARRNGTKYDGLGE